MNALIGNDRRVWQWLLLAAGVGVLIWLLAPILTPFVLSALLAWLGDPLVGRLERAGRARSTAVVLVFSLMSLVLLLGLLLLVPLVEAQIGKFVQWLPRFGAWLTGTAVPWIETRFDVSLAEYIDPSQLIDLLKSHWQQAGGVAASVFAHISQSGMAILGWVASLSLIPVVTFYFLRDWRPMLLSLQELLPRPLEPIVLKLARESDQVLGGFLRGQISVMAALALVYGMGLWMVGIDLGVLIGLIAGLVSFVPYLGAVIGVGAGVIAALVQYGDISHVLLVLLVFGVGQTLESFLLTPWLVGDRIGLPPVAVIFAIMAGGQLFGFLGVLLALPIAAVARVLLAYAHERYTQSHVYGAEMGSENISPEAASKVDAASAEMFSDPISDPISGRPDV